MNNAIMIEKNDDVVVVIEPVKKGERIVYAQKDGAAAMLEAGEDIPIYHKAAIKKIVKGGKVNKYGEHIGEATTDIEPGMHVHTHNVRGVREDLDE